MSFNFTKGNPAALKVAISANLSGNPLVVHVIEDGPVSSSVTFGEDTVLFSMNAAAGYLLNLKDDADVNQWLEWEATQLSPLVHINMVEFFNKKEDAAMKGALTSCLERLESTFLGSQQALYPIFWSSIYPLLTCRVVKDLDSTFPKLSKWFNDLAAHPEYVKAVKVVFPGDATSLLKESLCKLPLPDFDSSKSMMSKPSSPSGPTEEEVETAYRNWCGQGTTTLPERQHPVLPKEGMRNILITSALPYVNNVPHLGNIIGCVLSGDVYSRFCRLRGYNSLYISGTDEYGTATETKAVQEGLTPEEICAKYYALHAEIYDWFNIGFDYFGRTTTKYQTQISQEIFWKIHKNGFVFEDSVEQLRCESCERFLADRFVEGTCPLCQYEDARGDQCDKCGKLINATDLIKPKCKLCKAPPVVKSSDHLFIDLPKLVDRLSDHLATQFKEGNWTHNAKLITKSWLRDGLKPRCITRDMKWGTPVPLKGFEDKVFYVWFDAPIGYISITANYTDQWEKWWKNPEQVELINFMAKDNVPFHSVIFPCTLLGADDHYTVVNSLCATEYLNYEDDKFSKSRGVGVFGNDAQTTGIPADIWRFYLLYVRPESQDSTFSWDDFVLKNNSELLNNLGNFVNRALKFVADSYGGVIPEMEVTNEDKVLFAQITAELVSYVEKLEVAQLREGIWHMFSISRLGNQYFQSTTPWKLAKSADPADRQRAASVVGIAANVACLLSLLIHPYMPATSQIMRDQMNVKDVWKLEPTFDCHLKAGHKIGSPSPLFAKIDSALIADLKKRFAGTQATRAAAEQPVAAANPVEAAKLVEEIGVQGLKVRELKANKAEQAKINEEVAVLLTLKKRLVIAEGREPTTGKKTATNKKPATDKKSSAGKSNAAQQQASGTASTPAAIDQALVDTLTKKVEAQGLEVRTLKGSKAEKSKVDAGVSVLLDLKRQLAIAQGRDPDAKPARSKGKK